MRLLLLILFLFTGLSQDAQTGFFSVPNFGANPGSLSMYAYVPSGLNLSTPKALVVALHGCSQSASSCAQETGWNELADRNGFCVVYPEQSVLNNFNSCFNWFNTSNQQRGGAEPQSILSMISYMKNNFNIDTSKIYVSGLSAGGAMASIMLACYPDVFDKGAVFSGVPYTNVSSVLQANSQMQGLNNLSASQWGNLALSAFPAYNSSRPELMLFHGTADAVVHPMNQQEQIEQWTFVHQTDTIPELVQSNFGGNPFVQASFFYDAAGNEVVRSCKINGFGHAVPLDMGSCFQQCGQSSSFAIDINFSGTFWAADFFGITQPTSLSISGPDTVLMNQTNVVYSVSGLSGVCSWALPAGASIVSGAGTSQITVNFGMYSGNVSASVFTGNCEEGPLNFPVQVMNSSVLQENMDQSEYAVYMSEEQVMNVQTGKTEKLEVFLYSLDGKCVFHSFGISGYGFPLNEKIEKGVYLVRVESESGKLFYKKIYLGLL